MHDAQKELGGAWVGTPLHPDYAGRDGEVAGDGRYARSRQASEALVSATVSPAYRAERAEELERPSRPSAYCWLSLALVAAAFAWLIVAAVVGQAWLLAIAVGLALAAAGLTSCA